MRCRFAQAALAVAYLLGRHTQTHAQIVLPATNSPARDVKVCAPSSVDKQPSTPEVTIAELTFEGDLRMSTAEQDRISTSLKQRTYSGEPDGVASEVFERVRTAWQDRGYFHVGARGDAKVLSSSPVSERIGVAVQVDEGQQYLLGGIRFRNNRAISNEKFLRDLFPLKDGEIFSRKEIAEGLDNLRFAYGQLGYVNFTAIPNTRINEEGQTISLEVDVDEGKQFSVSSMRILGLDDHLLEDSPLRPGNIYNQRLARLFVQEHAPSSLADTSPDSRIHLQLDERAGTLAIAFDFRDCPIE